jgi:hypothetical protein
MTVDRITRTFASVAFVLTGCSLTARSATARPDLPTVTAVEGRALRCYQLGTPVRRVAERFSLLEQHGHGSGPERFGRLVRPRGAYNSAYWHAEHGDTIELVWTSSPSDSAGLPGTVILMDALRARVTQVGHSSRASGVGVRYLRRPGHADRVRFSGGSSHLLRQCIARVV